MRKQLAIAALLAALAAPAQAQVQCPAFVRGLVLSAGQWQACFDAKQNALGFVPVNKAGDVMTGRLVTFAPTASVAGFNLPHGTSPSAPANGDVWTTTAGMFVRINGATVGPVSGGVTITLTGDVTGSGITTIPTTVVNLPTGVTVAGSLLATNAAAPGTPAAGKTSLYVDSTQKRLSAKDDAGVVSVTVVPSAAVSNQFLTGITAAGAVTRAQPAFADVSGTIATGQVAGSYAGITAVGTLVGGATGAGFTIALATSTVTGNLPIANAPSIAANTVLGSIAGGTAAALTKTQLTTLINPFTTTLDGAVPNPGSATGKFLRDDQTWQAVAGAGTVTQVNCGGVAITSSGTCPEPFSPQNCSLAASVASNILTVALKDAAGNDPSAASPCRVPVRSTTAATGSSVLVTVSAALSVTTNAVGASIGCSNSTACRIWVELFNSGTDGSPTAALALYNASTATQCFPINEGIVQSTVAFTAGATSAGVFYTPNGTTLSNKPFRIVGYVEYNATGLATAGTYATAPNFIQTFGPSIKKPCEVVQVAPVASTATVGTSTGAVTATALSQSITLQSAANLVKYSLVGTLGSTAGTGVGIGQVYRAASAACTTAIGPIMVITSAAGAISSGTPWAGYDKPNTLSASFYTLCLSAAVAGNAKLNAGGGGDLSYEYLEEIQG